MGTKPGDYVITSYKGATLNEQFTVTNNGTPQDLTGCTAAMQVRRYDDSPIELELYTGDGFAPLDDTGVVSFTATAEQTNLIEPGNYKYDILITNGANISVFLKGKFVSVGLITQNV